jgi:hypothetical protein
VNEKRPPGSTVPESHPAWLDVVVCGIESAFVQVMVVPTVTSAISGLYALVVSAAAPIGIETDDDGPETVGAGVGAGAAAGVGEVAEYPLPLHAVATVSSIDTRHKRSVDIKLSGNDSRKWLIRNQPG